MFVKIWDKVSDINNIDYKHILDYRKDLCDEIAKGGNIILFGINSVVKEIHLESNLRLSYGNSLSIEDICETYLNLRKKEYEQQEKEQITLEETINKISILEAEQEVQNNEIMTSMIANTELFEMVLGMMPATLNTKNINNTKGVSSMVEVYVTLILKGQKTIDQVPAIIRDQVQAQLDLLTK